MLDLYETFYKLTADPFRLSPDHRFVLDHHSYAKSKSYLEYALHRGEGFIVITGGAGTGKTTLINEILAKLDKTQIQVATLNSTQLEARDLLHMVASSFGLTLKETDKAAILLELEEFLKQQGKKGRRAVLIVDEAQGLSQSALEELRLLANLQFNNRLLLQVFLVGQEPLRDLLDSPDMDHLRQRIVAASHLDPLKPDETVDYIEHRLNRVGWQGDPKIDAEALMLIHNFSGGIPRKVNLICSRLFLFGAIEKKHELLGADAKDVIGDLQQEYLMSPPMAVQGSGAVATVSRIGVPDEGFTTAFVHSLPRKINTPDKPTSVTQHHSPEQRSEKPEEPSNEATVQASNTPVENKIPPAETVEPAPVDNLMAVEPRHIPRTRTSKRSPRHKSTITAVVFLALLLAGLIVMFVIETDSADRTVASVDEKVVVEQKGTVQREAQITESLDETPRKTDQSRQVEIPEKPVAMDSGSEPSRAEDKPDSKNPILPAPEIPLATEEVTTSVGIRSPAKRLTTDAVSSDVASPEASPVPPPEAAAVPVTRPTDAIDESEDVRKEVPIPSIEAQRARLRTEAEQRLNKRLSERLAAAKKNSKRAPVSGGQPTVTVKHDVPVPATVPQSKPGSSLLSPGRFQSMLLAGYWTSHNKPATLLPSEINHCQQKGEHITCFSIPQSIGTKYGLATYKVETTLQDFSPTGEFQLSYRTLVRLVQADSSDGAGAGNNREQVTEHSMTCQLTQLSRILCQDEKGTKREYRQL